MTERDKILQRGIFTIKNPEFNAYVIWKDQDWVSKEDIEEYTKTGKVKTHIQQYALIFNDVWKAQQYLYETPELEGGMVFDLNQQEIWEDFIEKNLRKDITKMVLNRCPLEEQHQCSLITLNFSDYKDVQKICEVVKNISYCPGGYDYEKFLNKLNKK
jgi:hypothetical protein